MVGLVLLILSLTGCVAGALPLAYGLWATSGAMAVATVPMEMQAINQAEDLRRQAETNMQQARSQADEHRRQVETNMQAQKARDEERLKMEREKHEAWRREQIRKVNLPVTPEKIPTNMKDGAKAKNELQLIERISE